MAILNEGLAYLLDPAFQVESVAGKPLVGGYAEVFLAGTNTKIITCQDFDGTNNSFRIPLKNDGRAVILVQPQNHYDIYFYDSYGNLAFSRLNVIPAVGGELHLEGKKLTNIKNDDGTLSVKLNAASQNLNTYTIDSNHTPLGVESPLYFKEDTEDSVIIGLDETVIDEKVREAAKGFATQDDINRAVAAEAQIRSTNDNAIGTKADQAKSKADAVDTYVKQHEAEWSKDTTYTAGDHIGITNNVISVTGDVGKTYTAGANININAQNVISGKDWTSEIAAVESVADSKQDKLTAGSNIKIENNTISVTGEMGKIYTGVGSINVDNTKNEISIDDSGYAKSSDLAGKQDKLTDAQLSAISSVSGKQDKLTAGTNIGINGNVISVTGELGKTYTGENYVNVNNSTNKIGLTDTAKSKLDSFVGEFDLSAGNNITFRKSGNTVFIDGQQGGKTYTGVGSINVDNTNNQISISSLSLTGNGDLITLTDDVDEYRTVVINGRAGSARFSNYGYDDPEDAVDIVGGDVKVQQGYNGWVSLQDTAKAVSGKQDKLTDYTPSVWNAKQDALDWTPTIEDI
ncbi:MAG: hypothetical protein MJZ37_06945 [Bacilli bacterium]|nr:hypothetical protein [Bacilli bacterium]